VRGLAGGRLDWVAAGPIVGAVAALAGVMAPPAAARDWTVASPDRHLRATVSQAAPGAALRLLVRRDGQRVLSARLARGERFGASRRTQVRADFTTPAGKRRVHRLRARELTLRFARLRLQVRVANDGVAHRTLLDGHGPLVVDRQLDRLTLARSARAWLQRLTHNYERPYKPMRLRDAPTGHWGYPALVRTAADTWVLLTEADVDGRFAAAHLHTSRTRPGELTVELPRPRVRTTLPLRTPWRVAVIGSLSAIVGSDLPLALAPPARTTAEWIRPGRVAWSWWSNSRSPGELATQQYYVDFAAARGWEYVLVDEGWDPAWIPQLVAYARERGVGILLWARQSALATPARMSAAFELWESWGVAGIKLDFIGSDRQRTMRWYDEVARRTAALHLLVNFHGTTVPRGIQRTWPQVLTMEAVAGAEHYKGGRLRPRATRNTVLPFTRNAIGSMDYTPVTPSARRRDTTTAHELALSVVFESGLQHFADSPEAYARYPVAQRFLETVPAAWDDTRLLDGFPGRSATVARRHGDDWFVGAITAGARTIDAPLGFLTPGRRYEATVVTDAGGGALTETRRTVTRSDRLTVPLGPGGGFAARIAPAAG
jgi:alpha-glucosidase